MLNKVEFYGIIKIFVLLCGNKMPTRCNRLIFIADLIVCSTCFGHLYAHHQELESIIQVAAACRIWCLVFKLSVQCAVEGCVSGLRAAFYIHILSTMHGQNHIKFVLLFWGGNVTSHMTQQLEVRFDLNI
jgi:hypothetical protein